MLEYQCPGCGAIIAADPTSTPDVQCNSCSTIIKLGQDLPIPPLPTPGASTQSQFPPVPGRLNTPLPLPQPGNEGFQSGAHQDEVEDPGWKKSVMQPGVLSIGLVLAPVVITVVIGVILVFIRCITGIIGGEGDLITQGGEIVIGVISLWAVYILGMTFFYADRNWVTDFGLGVVIMGASIGMLNVVLSFPSTFFAVVGHLFYGYVATSTGILAVRLMAPYKGIGNVRYNESRKRRK